MKNRKIKIFATISCMILKKEIKAKLKNYWSGNYVLHFVGDSLDHFHLRDFGADLVIERKGNKWNSIIVNNNLKQSPSLG